MVLGRPDRPAHIIDAARQLPQPQPGSFGKLIGRWVVFRNFFEYTVHVVVAAMAVNWFHYYVVLWWLVAYRYLDVGPRRLLQKLYNTPEKRAARPWAPTLNWAVIASLYVLSGIAVYNRQILFAHVPGRHVVPHVPRHWETGLATCPRRSPDRRSAISC